MKVLQIYIKRNWWFLMIQTQIHIISIFINYYVMTVHSSLMDTLKVLFSFRLQTFLITIVPKLQNFNL